MDLYGSKAQIGESLYHNFPARKPYYSYYHIQKYV